MGVEKIVWNIRQSNLDKSVNTKMTLLINRWCAKKSKKVSLIAYNGQLAKEIHESIGYCNKNVVVLDNGCDCNEYKPDISASESLKRELGLLNDAVIVLSVTRDHPVKDVPSFIKAFARVHKKNRNTVAVMCGNGIDRYNKNIITICNKCGLEIGKDIYLLGMRNDIPRLMAGCSVYVLHSAGEAFPNTLIQAMSTGCLCVATDVGDVNRIIGQSEMVVLPRDFKLLAEKILAVISFDEEKKLRIRTDNRLRIETIFNIRNVVNQYESLFL